MCKKITFLLILSLLIISCSEDNSSGPSNENGSGSQGSEIPCNTSNEGMVIKPADSETERICKDGVWEVVLSSSSSVQVVESSSSEIINIPVPVNSSANENFSSIGEESSSSILSPGETTESSSSETEIIEQSSSSSEEIVESSSSEETKLYLCEDGETYVLDPANCEKVSSSSVIVVSSSSDNKPISSSSDIQESSSSEMSSSSVNQESSSSKAESSSSINISSSSNTESSSSGESSSSSLVFTGVCKTELEDYCTYGSLYDERDGQTYKTVKIGEQWWMAENLKFKDADSTRLKCQNDNNENCEMYGYLYSRKAALQDCPLGWRLPMEDDLMQLRKFVSNNKEKGKTIGQSLRSQNGGWDNTAIGAGVDAFGLNILSGGGYVGRDGFYNISKNAFFWQGDSVTSFPYCEYYTRVYYDYGVDDTDFVVGRQRADVCFNCGSAGNFFYVRCIKD
jgi:uncharacterized protein (TIGR02145 family)